MSPAVVRDCCVSREHYNSRHSIRRCTTAENAISWNTHSKTPGKVLKHFIRVPTKKERVVTRTPRGSDYWIARYCLPSANLLPALCTAGHVCSSKFRHAKRPLGTFHFPFMLGCSFLGLKENTASLMYPMRNILFPACQFHDFVSSPGGSPEIMPRDWREARAFFSSC